MIDAKIDDVRVKAKEYFCYFSSISTILSVFLFNEFLPDIYTYLVVIGFIYNGYIILTKKYNSPYFLIVVFISFLITSYVKFYLLDETGASPIVIYYEIALCITLVLCFGLKKTWWLFTTLIALSFLKIYLVSEYPSYNWVYTKNRTLPTFIFITYLISYIFLIILFYYTKMAKINQQLRSKVDELKNTIIVAENLQEKLLKATEDLMEFSSVNSHRLRAPISRIQGIIGLVEANALDDEWDEHKIYEFLYEQSISSLGEFKKVLSEMDETLHDKILELHNLYLSVDPDR